MKPTNKKKLSLSRTTIRALTDGELRGLGGGASPTFSASCDPDNCGGPTAGCVPQSRRCGTYICSGVLICV
jgi:hypothetical protein